VGQLKRIAGGWIDEDTDLAALGWQALLAAPIGIGAALADGRFLFANEALFELLGHPSEELIARGWIDVLFSDDEERAATKDLVAEIARGDERKTWRHQRQVLRADGSARVLDLTSTGFGLPDGRRGAMTTAVDVTDLWQPIGGARDAIREGLDAPDVLWRVDARSRRLLFVSRAIERMTGFGPEELYREPQLFRKQMQPEYAQRMQETLDLVVSTGKAQSAVLALRRRDGAPLLVHQAYYPVFDAAGRVIVVEGLARDITQVRALEQQLEATIDELRARNEELASLDKLKSQLLANVSHELRTPLVTVKGYAELLLRGALGPITPRQRRGLEIQVANAERLVDLIETLLDFARREEGRLSLRRQKLDLRVPVREAVAQLAERISARGIRLTCDAGPEPLDVDGDHARLAQLVKALVGNAEKFCDGPDGAIRVVTRRDADHVILEVYDTGIGIPEPARQKIFDRFYQVDSSTTRRYGGAGLGLALAKEIVTLHGGEIAVDSIEGLGSTFVVRLPPSSAAGEARGRDEQPVVLVGATEERWRSLKVRLEAEGFAALHAETGADLARRARRYRPDAVVLALASTGEIDDALDGLRSAEGEARLPVLAVADAAHRADLAARVDLAVEPGDLDALVTALRRLLRGEPAADRAARRPRVVIVDDEPSTLDFTRFVLDREGFEVVPVVSGEAALATVDEKTDLVILDLAMEGLDGIEVCRRLKGELRTRRVPVLIVTAMTGEEIRRDSLAAGADGFLVKPFGLSDFLQKVRLHLRADGQKETRPRSASGENA